MSDTFSSVYVHIVFGTKERCKLIHKEIRSEVWSYLGGIARKSEMKALAVGGVEDHVHILLSMPTTIAVAQAVQLLKGASSRWISREIPDLVDFAWQSGYGAFSVSSSMLNKIIQYINNQELHHGKMSYQQEIEELELKNKPIMV